MGYQQGVFLHFAPKSEREDVIVLFGVLPLGVALVVGDRLALPLPTLSKQFVPDSGEDSRLHAIVEERVRLQEIKDVKHDVNATR